MTEVGKQFDMRSNIKAKAGSQGTLFRVSPSARTPESRQPRGFSPERLREVQEVTRLNPQVQHPKRAGAVAAVRDNLARSTAPIDDMRGVLWYTHAETKEAVDGTYHSASSPRFGTSVAITLSKGTEHGLTPLHELGHHVSDTAGTPHSAYDTPEQRGAEEGYAENYSETHFRTPSGRTRESKKTAESWDRNAFFRKSFNDQRALGPFAAEKKARMDRLMSGAGHLPPEHIKGQIPLLHKNIGRTTYDDRAGTSVRQPDTWQYNHEDVPGSGK